MLTEAKAKQKTCKGPAKLMIDRDDEYRKQSADTTLQIESPDSEGNPRYMDSERSQFNFNNFNGWECSSGYSHIIPSTVVLRIPMASFQPPGNIETGFLFDANVTTGACVLMLIVKYANVKQVQNASFGDKTLIKVYDESWHIRP